MLGLSDPRLIARSLSRDMPLLDGIPTIIGGFDSKAQNGLLIQYHDRLKEWIIHPKIRMRIPRSSAAVFQVPRHLFPKQCS